MHEQMRPLLNAYLDGELHGKRLQEMERHLASCGACQEELTELRLVSDLLQASPVPEFMPAERFASNLSLNLPRRNLGDLPPKPGGLVWWLVPGGLLAAWLFVQTFFTLTGVVSAAQITGMLGHAASWLDGSQETLWYAVLANLVGTQAAGMQPTLLLLNGLTVFGVNLLKGFLWQSLIVFLYWGWLSFWWFRRRPYSMKVVNA